MVRLDCESYETDEDLKYILGKLEQIIANITKA
jgi:hypothetical protein